MKDWASDQRGGLNGSQFEILLWEPSLCPNNPKGIKAQAEITQVNWWLDDLEKIRDNRDTARKQDEQKKQALPVWRTGLAGFPRLHPEPRGKNLNLDQNKSNWNQIWHRPSWRWKEAISKELTPENQGIKADLGRGCLKWFFLQFPPKLNMRCSWGNWSNQWLEMFPKDHSTQRST